MAIFIASAGMVQEKLIFLSLTVYYYCTFNLKVN